MASIDTGGDQAQRVHPNGHAGGCPFGAHTVLRGGGHHGQCAVSDPAAVVPKDNRSGLSPSALWPVLSAHTT
jgi:hypothetical protein